MRIRPSHDRALIAESLDPSGAVELRFTLRAIYDMFKGTYCFKAEGSHSSLSVKCVGTQLLMKSSLSTLSYEPVSRPANLQRFETELWYPSIRHLLGLTIASYGSHGLETISIQLSHPETSNTHHPSSIGHPRLEGLKIIGDRNVPAAQFSFLIDLSCLFNPHRRLEQDPRPVIAVPQSGPLHVFDLRQRIENVQCWFRGMGQINKMQAIWMPEWVGVDFVVYKDSKLVNGALFSLVWDDDEMVRHIIDYKPLEVMIEPDWLTPPTLNVEETMNAEDGQPPNDEPAEV